MSDEHRLPERDRPWMMRTYAGHSDARRSNELYRKNLEKGQTGLSVAFDLPTQTGYDPDDVLAQGEVGKVGVSIANKGDMHQLLDGIPLDEMNTSMTINATAAWLLGLYVAVAEENGIERSALAGTTQNDIIKEYLSRGTYAFPPAPSMRLIADTVAFTVNEIPKWNPINVCSYHLQEAGATPVQEIAYALSNAIAVLDEVKARGQVSDDDFPKVFGRVSFFVNAGVRFIEEHAKLRAMTEIWEQIGRERYGVTDPKLLRLRYGVQVNSLGLTEAQPENNVPRIVLEALGVTMGRGARARAIQLPAWNEALGLPRPWDQQWSLRIQQILAFETDLLEYPDIFEGSKVMEGLVEELTEGARAEMKVVEEHGGAVEAVPYMKARLVESHRERIARIEAGELTVVGQNAYTESEDSPLTVGEDGGILTPDPEVERERVEALELWRSEREQAEVDAALAQLAEAARDESTNIMPATIAAAKAGATTGEWARTLREVFGDYRGPTGVEGAGAAPADPELIAEVREKVAGVSESLGHPIRILVGKPGLDGHSNGAEQIAVRARDVGMEVIYEGIRLNPQQIAASAVQEDVDVVGLSILSGSHRQLVPQVVELLREEGADVPVVVGGIIPPADAAALTDAGVARVYTPKDFDLNKIMGEIAELVAERRLSESPGHGLMADPINGEQSSWLRCYRCWARDLEVQLHYDAILRIDPESGEPADRVDEVQEAVVQCLRCLHDQPHLTIEEDRVVPVEDRWERMVAGKPYVASCTVTVDQDQVETCAGPEAAESLTYGAFGEQGTREFFTHVRFHKHDDERIVVHLLVELYARTEEEAAEVLEGASRGTLELTSLAEESRPPAHAPDEAH